MKSQRTLFSITHEFHLQKLFLSQGSIDVDPDAQALILLDDQLRLRPLQPEKRPLESLREVARSQKKIC